MLVQYVLIIKYGIQDPGKYEHGLWLIYQTEIEWERVRMSEVEDPNEYWEIPLSDMMDDGIKMAGDHFVSPTNLRNSRVESQKLDVIIFNARFNLIH